MSNDIYIALAAIGLLAAASRFANSDAHAEFSTADSTARLCSAVLGYAQLPYW